MAIGSSIRGKFIIMVLAICLSCLLVVSVISYLLAYNIVKEQTNQGASEVVAHKASQINNWFEEQGQAINSMAHDIEINGNFSDEYLANFLLRKFERQEDKVLDYYIGFADPGRAMVSATGWIPPPDYDVTDREWYKEALEADKLIFITPYLDADSGQMVITLAEPLWDEEQLVGVIAADILLTEIIKLAHTVQVKEASYVFLLDEKHSIITHPEPILLPTAERTVNIAYIMEGKFKPLIEVIENGSYNIIELKDYDQIKRYFILSNVEVANWTFGVAIPRSEYLKPLNTLLIGFGIAFAISLIMGIIIILPVIRSLLKPVLQLNKAVSSFAAMDFTARSQVSSQDEVGKLSDNFNHMADIIQEYNQKLEQKVVERTAAISNLLNNAGQGFLSFGADFIIDAEYSMECEEIFEQEIAGKRFMDLIFPNGEEEKLFMENVLASIMRDSDELRREIYFSLLPSELIINGKHIFIEYKLIINPFEANNIKIMIILTDITEQRHLEQQMEKEGQLLKMVVKVVAHNNDFKEYCYDFRNFSINYVGELLESNHSREEVFNEIYRKLHTLKGGFAQLEMSNLVEKLHQFESQLADNQEDLMQMSAQELKEYFALLNMSDWLEDDFVFLREILGEQFFEQDNIIAVDESKLAEINRKIVATLSPWECKMLLPDLKQLMYKPFRDLLKSYPETVARLGEKLNKLLLPMYITGGEGLVDTEKYRDFTKSLIHVFRNSVDHGIETPEERAANGKSECGAISCDISHNESGITITIADDGKGIDVQKLKEKALQSDIYEKEIIAGFSDEEALHLIFADKLSCLEEINTISGRGIGLAAVMGELDKLRGTVDISSQIGQGTIFTFYLPNLDSNKVFSITANDIIKPLLDTMQNYFRQDLGEELKHCSATENKDRLPLYKTTAISNIKGIVRSSFILSVDESLGHELVHKMILDDIEPGTEDIYVEDVLAECANIILGNSIECFPEVQELIMFEAPVTISSQSTAIKYINAIIWTGDMIYTSGKASVSIIIHE